MNIESSQPTSQVLSDRHQLPAVPRSECADCNKLGNLESESHETLPTWRLAPVIADLQALSGVHWLVAITFVAELGDLTRFDAHAS